MIIKDLVNQLSKFPSDKEFVIGLSDEGTENEIATVEIREIDGIVEMAEVIDSPFIFDEHLRLGLPAEFVDLCTENKTSPREVLHGFIADLCELHNFVDNPRADTLSSNGSDERRLANEYFERVGHRHRG